MPSIHHMPTSAGIGLRLPHIEEAVAPRPPVAWLEIQPCGARGTFRFSRLSTPDTFRASLAAGLTLGEAAAHALERDGAFDPGAALMTLAQEGHGRCGPDRRRSSVVIAQVGREMTAVMRPLQTGLEALNRVPLSVLQLLMRIGVGAVFFNAGLLKYRSWELTLLLFRDEHKVPLFDPAPMARMATFNELTFSTLLFLGLAGRIGRSARNLAPPSRTHI